MCLWKDYPVTGLEINCPVKVWLDISNGRQLLLFLALQHVYTDMLCSGPLFSKLHTTLLSGTIRLMVMHYSQSIIQISEIEV